MRSVEHKDGIGTVTFDWKADEDNPYKFAGYEVTIHNEKKHEYQGYFFEPDEYEKCVNFFLKARTDLFGKD